MASLIAQARAPTIRVGSATVLLPPAAFLQATAEGEAALARLVSDICATAKPKKGSADLFAGIGPFALRLAEQTRVTAADDDEAALAALVARRQHAGPETRHHGAARSVQEPVPGRRAQPLRRRGVRSAAPGRAGAIARDRGKPRSRRSPRSRAIPAPSPAMRGS